MYVEPSYTYHCLSFIYCFILDLCDGNVLFALHKQPDTLLTLEGFSGKFHPFSNNDVYYHPSTKLWSMVIQLIGPQFEMGDVWSDNYLVQDEDLDFTKLLPLGYFFQLVMHDLSAL